MVEGQGWEKVVQKLKCVPISPPSCPLSTVSAVSAGSGDIFVAFAGERGGVGVYGTLLVTSVPFHLLSLLCKVVNVDQLIALHLFMLIPKSEMNELVQEARAVVDRFDKFGEVHAADEDQMSIHELMMDEDVCQHCAPCACLEGAPPAQQLPIR